MIDERDDVPDEWGSVTDEHRDEDGGPARPLESDQARPDETVRRADVFRAGDAEDAGVADEPVAADEPVTADDSAGAEESWLVDGPAADDESPSDAADEATIAGEPLAPDAATAGDAWTSTLPDVAGKLSGSDEASAEVGAGVADESSPSGEPMTEDASAPWTLVPVMEDSPAAAPREPAAAGRPHGAPQPATPVGEAEAVRSIDGELARLHLRTGMLALARAELETMAGWSALDREALIDLAEVRWRTGDLVGAGEAAAAYLEVGGDEPIAFCVAAEAALAGGRRADAEAYAARAVDLAASRLDELFAGQPRSSLWPAPLARTTPSRAGTSAAAALPASWLAAPAADETPTQAIPGAASVATTEAGRAAGGSVAIPEAATPEAAAPEATTTEKPIVSGSSANAPAGPIAAGMPSSAGMSSAAGTPPPAGTWPAAGGWSPAGPPAAGELAEAERRLASGELLGFALRLQVVLRLQPALAPAVLALADAALQAHAPSADEAAAIHLVRSDACRLTGREVLSGAAMQEARRALHATTAAEDSP